MTLFQYTRNRRELLASFPEQVFDFTDDIPKLLEAIDIMAAALELEKIRIAEITKFIEAKDDEDGLASRIMQQFEYGQRCRIDDALVHVRRLSEGVK